MGEIAVTARRARAKPTEAGWPRAPVNEVALTYTVSPASFDLTTAAGRAGLEKAVADTAMDVCKEIGKQYPGSAPDDSGCAKAAADKAMVKVREVEAAAVAAKKGTK
jgi:UrcA family protein